MSGEARERAARLLADYGHKMADDGPFYAVPPTELWQELARDVLALLAEREALQGAYELAKRDEADAVAGEIGFATAHGYEQRRANNAEERVAALQEALHAECRPEIGECYAPQPLIDILGPGRCSLAGVPVAEEKTIPGDPVR